MSNELGIGNVISGKPERDAIHIAIVPLIAGRKLWKGEYVKLALGSVEIGLSADYDEGDAIGIVDPFLREPEVHKGERFWCFLFPGTVTGLRHHWQHPAFTQIETVGSDDEQWIRAFADRWCIDYDELIQAAIGTDERRYAVARGIELHSANDLGEDYDLFWEHLEGLTGDRYSKSHREGMGWSCGC